MSGTRPKPHKHWVFCTSCRPKCRPKASQEVPKRRLKAELKSREQKSGGARRSDAPLPRDCGLHVFLRSFPPARGILAVPAVPAVPRQCFQGFDALLRAVPGAYRGRTAVPGCAESKG